jgi:hypothetical protein
MAEPCGTSACISLGVDISPSTETLNFLWERKEPISLIRLIDNFNLDVVSKAFFNIQEYRSRRHVIVEI